MKTAQLAVRGVIKSKMDLANKLRKKSGIKWPHLINIMLDAYILSEEKKCKKN